MSIILTSFLNGLLFGGVTMLIAMLIADRLKKKKPR